LPLWLLPSLLSPPAVLFSLHLPSWLSLAPFILPLWLILCCFPAIACLQSFSLWKPLSLCGKHTEQKGIEKDECRNIKEDKTIFFPKYLCL
jgi:hypothetical protein